MKTLKSLMLGLVMLAVCGVAKAANKPEKLTKNYAITAYVNAMSHGQLAGLKDAVDASAKFSMLRGTDVISFSKAEVMSFLKGSEGVEQLCTVRTTEMENNDNVTVVKVDMKYEHFTRSNYVTIANTGDGWKITNVYSVFSK